MSLNHLNSSFVEMINEDLLLPRFAKVSSGTGSGSGLTLRISGLLSSLTVEWWLLLWLLLWLFLETGQGWLWSQEYVTVVQTATWSINHRWSRWLSQADPPLWFRQWRDRSTIVGAVVDDVVPVDSPRHENERVWGGPALGSRVIFLFFIYFIKLMMTG